MTHILIAGYYGLGNIGDELILSGIINAISTYTDDVKFSVITNNPAESKHLHNVMPVPQSLKKGAITFIKNQITQREFVNVYKNISECDILILGGGELLQDLKFYYLPTWLSLLYLAQKKNKKTVVYGIGAGPVDTFLGKKLCRKILGKADLVTVRDSKSEIALENCGVPNVIKTADPAFAISPPKVNLHENEKTIGVTLHRFIYNDDMYRKTNGEKINLSHRRKKMAYMLESIAEIHGKKLMFLPTVKSDVYGYTEIKKFMHDTEKALVIDYDSNINRFFSLLAKSEILIGMRLHSLIMASMLGIPIVPISYSGKVKSFLELINLNDLYIDIEDIDAQDFNERLYENFSKVLKKRTYYSNLLLSHSEVLRKRSLENGKMVAELIEDH